MTPIRQSLTLDAVRLRFEYPKALLLDSKFSRPCSQQESRVSLMGWLPDDIEQIDAGGNLSGAIPPDGYAGICEDLNNPGF